MPTSRLAALLSTTLVTTIAAAQCANLWQPVTNGPVDMRVIAQVVMPNGDLVVGGGFTTIGGIAANRVARWNGTAWSTLGAGTDGPVYALAVLPNGDLVAGGFFNAAGGVSSPRLARWNGTGWAPLGSNPGYTVNALTVLPNGELIAGGQGLVATSGSLSQLVMRWNGSAWLPMGAGAGWVSAMCQMQNGDLVVAGLFSTVDGVAATNVARWDGANWSAIGGGTDHHVNAVVAMPNGDLVAGGIFSLVGGVAANRIARWNGIAWSPLGSGVGAGFPYSLLALPDGDLLVGGTMSSAGGVAANNIARWDGASWAAVGSGCDSIVSGLLSMPDGAVIATGDFLFAGGSVSGGVAKLVATCPASAVSQGAGCSGSGGPNVLAAATLPWTGGTFRANATGMPALALVLAVYGFTPLSMPMAAVLPQGLPGCSVHMTADHIDVLLPASGSVMTSLALPDAPALAGQVLLHYVVPFEFDAAFQLVAISSSNALALTVGSF